ncbi:Fc.00g030440.m01.CDS01 [Cosmosporella sp. VM-42]
MGRQPRQRPISCQFCRVRKLRCSRQFPCSNCTSRGVPCREPGLDPPPATRPAATKASSASPASAAISASADPEILSRLERLETLLALRVKEKEPEVEATSQKSTQSSPVAATPQTPLPPQVQGLTADALFLEQCCMDPQITESVLADNIVFRTCPIRLITRSSSYVFQNSNVPSASLTIEPTKCIWLPERCEAASLIDKYIADLTHVHHVIHGPSLRTFVHDVYDSLQNGTPIPIGYVALLLSVFANVTYSWTAGDYDRKLFLDPAEANAQAIFWVKAGWDALDYCQRCAHSSVESVQAHIILGFVICNFEGLSWRGRTTISKSIVMARELGLHRIDCPHNGPFSQPTRLTGLRAEIGRRVWWYLVGTDWMLARFSGPHEGTYTIQPRHMIVRKPLNINDDDLKEGEEWIEKPMGEPTSMSYFLQRVRLAEVCQAFTERMPLAVVNPEMVNYNDVMELDAAIDRYISEIPPFFVMSRDELMQLPPSDPRRSNSIMIQRHILNLFVYGQRCKLHLPYLARGTIEPAYAYSKDICLESARLVIQTERRLEKEKIAFVSTRLRLTVVLFSVFLASIVLLLDVCMGKDAEDKLVKQREMLDAWRILDAAQAESVPAARLLELLKQVMRKHKVPIPVVKVPTEVQPRPNSRENVLPLTPRSAGTSTSMTPLEPAYSAQVWEDPESRMDLDGIDWDSLFWGLEAPFI